MVSPSGEAAGLGGTTAAFGGAPAGGCSWSPAVAAGAPAGASSGPPPAAMPMGISSLPVSK